MDIKCECGSNGWIIISQPLVEGNCVSVQCGCNSVDCQIITSLFLGINIVSEDFN